MSNTIRNEYHSREKYTDKDKEDRYCYNCGEQMYSSKDSMCLACKEDLEEFLNSSEDDLADI